MAQPLAAPFSYFADSNGAPLAGGKVYTYAAGTTTPQNSYTDSTGTIAAAQPVILDSAGRATIWLSGYYKIVVKDSLDNTIHTDDNITALGATGDMSKSVYDIANIQEQLVGLTASQTLTNKTLTSPVITAPTITNQTSVNGGQLAGYRNFLLNGNMNIWQRGTSFTPTAGTITYTADRWCVQRQVNAGYTVSRQAAPATGIQYAMRIQRTAANANTDVIYLAQPVETNSSIQLQGATVVLSFYAKCGADYSAASTGLLSILTSGTGTNENTLSGYTGQAVVASATSTLTTSYQRFQITGSVASGATEIGIQFRFTPTGTAGTNDYFDIYGVQLEVGGVATSLETLPFISMLNMCRRFCKKTFAYATTPAQNSTTTGAMCVMLPTGATGTFGASFPFGITMFSAPTITTYNTSATNANWRDTTNSADRTVTVGIIGDDSFALTGASGVAASTNRIHYLAEAEL